MARFIPCVSRSACSDEGSHCRGCGRSHEEIARIRAFTSGMAQFLLDAGYDNPEEFLSWAGAKALKKVRAAEK